MKVDKYDRALIASLLPSHIAAYLSVNGWLLTKSKPGSVSVWRLSRHKEDYEIELPLDEQMGDFVVRVAEIIRTLEVVEDRSQLAILTDLARASADTVRVRISSDETFDGTVSINDGVDIFASTRDLLLAAACSAKERRAYFQTRKPSEAMAYMQKVRLGQTERGSFVVNVISRVPPAMTSGRQPVFFEIDEPFERKVTVNLARSLVAVQSAVKGVATTMALDEFESAVSSGVTANLCDAIVGLGSGIKERDVTVEFSWATARPLDDDTPRRCVIPRGSMDVLREASRQLKAKSPVDDFGVWGPIIRLERPVGADIGKVTVRAIVEDESRNVTIELEEPDYGKAVLAHESRTPITCVGQLEREGRSFRLVRPTGFVVDTEE